MKKTRIAVLASGGIDSSILLADSLKRYQEVYPIYVRCGYVWEKAELHWLKKYLKALQNKKLKPLTVLNLPLNDLNSNGWAATGRNVPGYHSLDEEVFLPGRNLLLLSKAAAFCFLKKIPTIAIGSLSANPFPDATRRFFDRFGQTASQALRFHLQIVTPFLKRKKRDLIKKGKSLPLQFSFSCLAPRGLKPCGRCNKCAERDKVVKK